MLTMTVPVSRPRVYLIDFEVAVEFPAECPPAERISRGYPLGSSFPDPKMYSRPLAPEITNVDDAYSPFKLDVWQLGSSFKSFRVRILLQHISSNHPLYRLRSRISMKRSAT
jgi:hypothetical protein